MSSRGRTIQGLTDSLGVYAPGHCRSWGLQVPKSRRQRKEQQRRRKKREYRMTAHVKARTFREVKLIAQDLIAALCQDMKPGLSDARVSSLTSWYPASQRSKKRRKKRREAGSRRGSCPCPRRGSSCLLCPPRWPGQADCCGRGALPVLVPCGCHADPQAVFADVVFDFTRLELQLRHFTAQGCHDSRPHVPWVAHTLGEGVGPADTPTKPRPRSPLSGVAGNVGSGSTLGVSPRLYFRMGKPRSGW